MKKKRAIRRDLNMEKSRMITKIALEMMIVKRNGVRILVPSQKNMIIIIGFFLDRVV